MTKKRHRKGKQRQAKLNHEARRDIASGRGARGAELGQELDKGVKGRRRGGRGRGRKRRGEMGRGRGGKGSDVGFYGGMAKVTDYSPVHYGFGRGGDRQGETWLIVVYHCSLVAPVAALLNGSSHTNTRACVCIYVYM